MVVLVALLAGGGRSGAAPSHGIAMHGAPKYGAGFDHLDYVNPGAPKGGELRRAVTGTFDNLNPFIIKGVPAHGRHLVFESLLKRVWDEPFSLYGLIAESIEAPDDRSSVTFVLRPEARFHDGSPITVDDVVFSWEILKEQGRPNHRLYYRQVRSVERPDGRSVRFIFDAASPDRELPLIMGLMPILSKSYYTAVTFEGNDARPADRQWPLSCRERRCGPPNRLSPRSRLLGAWPAHQPRTAQLRPHPVRLLPRWRCDDGGFQGKRIRPSPGILREALGNRLRLPCCGGRPGSSSNACRTVGPPACPLSFSTPAGRFSPTARFATPWRTPSTSPGSTRRCCTARMSARAASSITPNSARAAFLKVASAICWNRFATACRVSCSRTPTAPPAVDGGIRANLKAARRLLTEAGWTVHEGSLQRAADGLPMAFEILLVDPANEKIALSFARNLERLGVEARVPDRRRIAIPVQAKRLRLRHDRLRLGHVTLAGE